MNKIFLEWTPSEMIEDMGGIDSQDGGVGVEIISGDDTEYQIVDVTKTVRGGKFEYIIRRVPCERQNIRFFAKNSEGIEYLNHKETITASSSEEIENSSFDLEAPSDVVGMITGEKLIVTWNPSKCATGYWVRFHCLEGSATERYPRLGST